jgi:hypothetical protein
MGIIELLFGRKNQPETEEVDRRLGRIGARMVIESPTELQRVSPMEAVCPTGRMVIEVPPPARGFHLETPQLNVVDLGTSFGVDATRGQTEVHVFKVEFFAWTGKKQSLCEGRATVVQGGAPPKLMAANSAAFTPMFESIEAVMALLRQQRRVDPDQSGRSFLFEGKASAACLARGWQRPRRNALEK